MNILVWNVQGAGSKQFQNVLQEHIRRHRPSIMALVETRISGSKAQAICNSTGFRRNFRVEAQGFQGGIWVLWHEEDIEIVIVQSHDQFVTVGVKSQNSISWYLTFVYASPHTQRREILWQELHQVATDCRLPWLLAGDFNETTSLDERNHGGPDMRRRCARFKHWIENNGLIDLGFWGPKFTWARGLSAHYKKEARLDRALCNDQWRVKFSEGAVRHLIQAGSDHSPLLIATGGFTQQSPSKSPFRFQVAWSHHGQFEKVVADSWQSTYPLMEKLGRLAADLTVWNRETFGNLFARKRKLWSRIEGIQRSLENGGPSYLCKLERKLREELDKTLDQIALLWFQMARIEQIRDGDRNTKYFHTSTIIRRRFNRIEALRNSNEEWLHDLESIKCMVVDHFKHLFSEDNSGLPTEQTSTVSFPSLCPGRVQDLE